MKKMMLKEVRSFAQGHSAGKSKEAISGMWWHLGPKDLFSYRTPPGSHVSRD